MRARTLLAIGVTALLAIVTVSCIIGPKHDDPDTVCGPTKDASIDVAFDPEAATVPDSSSDTTTPPPPSDSAPADSGLGDSAPDASDASDAVSDGTDGGEVGDTGGDG
jgi:hypothetical protein